MHMMYNNVQQYFMIFDPLRNFPNATHADLFLQNFLALKCRADVVYIARHQFVNKALQDPNFCLIFEWQNGIMYLYLRSLFAKRIEVNCLHVRLHT